MEPKLPDFFLVGAAKAGTTSLYHYLDQHPGIYMSPVKEPNYFASELRPENFSKSEQPRIQRDIQSLREYLDGPMTEKRFGGLVLDWNDYCKLFREAPSDKAAGEASVCYLWSETAARNIAERIPRARILIVLRDPAERAFSQYLHGLSIGLVKWSFREHMQANLANREKVFGPAYPFLEMGMYFEQVRRFLSEFPAEQVKIDLYDDYQRDPAGFLSALFNWLGVNPDFRPDLSRRHLELPVPRFTAPSYFLLRYGFWNRLKQAIPKPVRTRLRDTVFQRRRALTMTVEDRAFLVDYYRDDIVRLSQLIGRDLTRWLQVNP